MVYIIGVGTGMDMMTVRASRLLEEALVIIGASRIIDSYQTCFGAKDKQIFREYDVKKIKEIVKELEGEDIVILVSGDTGFYSLSDSLCKELKNCEVIPGISSVNAFFAKLRLPWQDAALVSLHGRNKNLVDMVRRNRKTFALTGNNIPEIADCLIEAGYENLSVYVGSNLDTEDELIECVPVPELKNKKYDQLTVLLILNEEADASVRSGIADEEFIRGEVPMTKSEVRASIISKLNIKPNEVCYDIGAGTGSVTVELALSAWEGSVIAIEKKPEGVALIKNNLKKFHIGNTKVFCGEATEILNAKVNRLDGVNTELPTPDVAFIGGSDGHLKEIILQLLEKNSKVRIVVSAIALESLSVAMETFKELGKEIEITQLSVSKSRGAGGLHLMMANNPIFLIKGL